MHSKTFIGVDEAGYGPNLGPLVVAASVWSAPCEFTERQFAESFAETFSPKKWTVGCQHVPLGDSKQLYQPSTGLATLEAGLLAMQTLCQRPCTDLGELLEQVASGELLDELQARPWFAGCSARRIPQTLIDTAEVLRLAGLARAAQARCGLELVALRAAVVTAERFNAAVAPSNSKGQLLSQTTLGLVAQALELGDAAVEVFCDRQGGRKNYLPNLLQALPEEWFTETAVSPTRSSYRNCGPRRLEIHFSVGGDRFPPTALASMLAKYLRERLMESWNAFWQLHLPGIKPTAGYPLDARRFRREIEPLARELQLPLELWWRCK